MLTRTCTHDDQEVEGYDPMRHPGQHVFTLTVQKISAEKCITPSHIFKTPGLIPTKLISYFPWRLLRDEGLFYWLKSYNVDLKYITK